jgi:hypothetical protein
MNEGDEILLDCNESELHWMARLQGLPKLRWDLPHEELVALVSGAAQVEERHMAATNYSRTKLAEHIQKNWSIVQGQLPGCDGKCRSFMCTEGKHMSCFIPNEPFLL